MKTIIHNGGMMKNYDIFAYTSGASRTGVNDANSNGHAAFRVLAANNAQISAFNPDNGVPWPGTGNKTSFTDTTTPNMKSWSGSNTNKPITNIIEKNQVVEFSFMGAPVEISNMHYHGRFNAFKLYSSAKEIKIAKIEQNFAGGRIKVYSCNGATVYEGNINKQCLTISISNLSNGFYFVSVSNKGNSKNINNKICIIH